MNTMAIENSVGKIVKSRAMSTAGKMKIVRDSRSGLRRARGALTAMARGASATVVLL
jgi:hypothetical protein